jgi:hypothetical protein
MTSFRNILRLKFYKLRLLIYNFGLKYFWNWSFFHYKKIWVSTLGWKDKGVASSWEWHAYLFYYIALYWGVTLHCMIVLYKNNIFNYLHSYYIFCNFLESSLCLILPVLGMNLFSTNVPSVFFWSALILMVTFKGCYRHLYLLL